MRSKKDMKKKGSLVDFMYIGGTLLVFGIIMLIGFTVTSNIDTQINSMSAFTNQTEALGASNSMKNTYTGIIDNIFLVLAIGLIIVTLVSASLVRVHPAFLAIFLIAWLIIVFFSAILSNIYEGFETNAQLSVYASQFTFINLILNWLPLIVGVFGIVMMVIMYKVWE